MASTVHIVLRQDLENLGRSGDLIKVRPGYARNFLIPRGMAAMATRGNIEQIEHERRIAFGKAEKIRKAFQVEADKLKSVVIQVAKEAGPEGQLFGSVTAPEIISALERKGIDIDRKKLIMPDEAIKMVGDYEIGAHFGPDVTGTFKLTVVTKS